MSDVLISFSFYSVIVLFAFWSFWFSARVLLWLMRDFLISFDDDEASDTSLMYPDDEGR